MLCFCLKLLIQPLKMANHLKQILICRKNNKQCSYKNYSLIFNWLLKTQIILTSLIKMCFSSKIFMVFVNRGLAEVRIRIPYDLLHFHSHHQTLLLCTGSWLVFSGTPRAFFHPANGNSVHLERIFWGIIHFSFNVSTRTTYFLQDIFPAVWVDFHLLRQGS